MVVVDDDLMVRRAVSRLLIACGLSVVTFASAEDFLGASHGADVACLVVDVSLGGMSGLELLVGAARGARTSAVPITFPPSPAPLPRRAAL
jgi:FixJ family two-component response regulator